MSNVDAFIDHSDDDISTALRYVPSLRRANQIHSIKLIEERIVWRRRFMKNVVRFGIENIVERLESRDRFQGFIRRHACDAQAVNQIRSFKAIKRDWDLFL